MYNNNKQALSTGNSFAFTKVTVNETYNLLMKMDCKSPVDLKLLTVNC